MPEMTFDVRWPDGTVQSLYSPSLVVHDHLRTGARYTVADFTGRATEALATAGERVRAKYGFACTSAVETTSRIRTAAAGHRPDDLVTVVAMNPPHLPDLPDP